MTADDLNTDDTNNDPNPLRDLIGEENYAAMPEADREWMCSMMGDSTVIDQIQIVGTLGEEEDEELTAAQFDSTGKQTGGSKMPHSVRLLLRKILGMDTPENTKRDEADSRALILRTSNGIAAAQYAASRVAASAILDHLQASEDLNRHEILSAHIVFDEMMCVRFMEQAIYDDALAMLANGKGNIRSTTHREFKQALKVASEEVTERLVGAALSAAKESLADRYNSIRE